MAHLRISYIGPVNAIDIDLNRINVFLGPQSSGKSTIAKILSFCQWVQKDVVEHQGASHIDNDYVQEGLIEFHNLKGYFTAKSEFYYEGRCADLHYLGRELSVSVKGNLSGAEVSKNAYIPSERNIVGIPQSLSMELPSNYLRSFLTDWMGVRTNFGKTNAVVLPNLGVSYFYNESIAEDMILLDAETERGIALSQASSGLQSVTPLYVYMKYLTEWIYRHKESRSPMRMQQIREVSAREALREELSELWGREEYQQRLDDLTKQLAQLSGVMDLSEGEGAIFKRFTEMEKQLSRPKFSNIVLEEPEQNLFPQTQADLIYSLLGMVNASRHNLVITTHSPFVIYAINNCMKAHTLGDRLASVPELSFGSDAATDPTLVSVWELRDGFLQNIGGEHDKTIQDEQGLIRSNYFDRVMRGLMTDFKNLLSFS